MKKMTESGRRYIARRAAMFYKAAALPYQDPDSRRFYAGQLISCYEEAAEYNAAGLAADIEKMISDIEKKYPAALPEA